MLTKIVFIKNVGTFRDCPASGDTTFRRLTLIHADNGRGKTTLCAILRSLQSGNPTLVLERKTLDSDDAPHIRVLVNAGNMHEFHDGNWGAVHPTLEIFDANFVNDNVYSGDDITHDHKKNLCRIVLGEDGVKLAKAFDNQDGLIREVNNKVNAAKAIVEKLLPPAMSVDAYIALTPDPTIDEQIEKKKAELAAQQDSASIHQRQLLTPIAIPATPANIVDFLARSIEDVAVTAEIEVRAHIVKHSMGRTGEAWLSQGLSFLDTADCPFCAQSLEKSPIIQYLRAYFSKAYESFTRQITAYIAEANRLLNMSVLLPVQRTIEGNNTLGEFWRRYRIGMPPVMSFDERIQPVFQELQKSLTTMLEAKSRSPLEVQEVTTAFTAAFEEWAAVGKEIEAYNIAVRAFNQNIEELRGLIGQSNPASVQSELTTLNATKNRFDPTTIQALIDYLKAAEEKASAETEKVKARTALEEYNAAIISRYKDAVNGLLRRFGAQFTLDTVKVEYYGGTPRAGYTFALRGKQIDPGNERTPVGAPCFRNTLSAGDRSTLALAFFIAQINGRADIANLVVVFDDPFTSLDLSRQTWTCLSIRKMATAAKQVIVLSHSVDFLKLVSAKCDAGLFKALKIGVHNRIDSRIIELDLDDATATLIERDVITLRSFVSGDESDMLATIRCIRPLLENHIRTITPDQVPKGDGWLGSFLGKIRDADAASPLTVFKPLYDELDALNQYTTPFHHDSGNMPPVDDAELRTQARLALQCVGRPTDL